MEDKNKQEEVPGQPDQTKDNKEEKPDSIDRADLKLETDKDLSLEKAIEEVKNNKDDEDEEDTDVTDDKDEEGVSWSTPSQAGDQKEQKKIIENILSEGLESAYMALPPNKQKTFRKTGEEVANKINNLLNQTKVNIKKITELIKKWLLVIPGVNLCFMEQEAKIKADKIAKLK